MTGALTPSSHGSDCRSQSLRTRADNSWAYRASYGIGGRYRLDAVLGEGGMSMVYVAYDQRLQRNVAFKLLVPSLAYSREVVTRFVNEARTLARLDSPHIVRVYDAGVTSDPERAPLPFMVLELLRAGVASLLMRAHDQSGSWLDGGV